MAAPRSSEILRFLFHFKPEYVIKRALLFGGGAGVIAGCDGALNIYNDELNKNSYYNRKIRMGDSIGIMVKMVLGGSLSGLVYSIPVGVFCAVNPVLCFGAMFYLRSHGSQQ